jgi:hypothetical protein
MEGLLRLLAAPFETEVSIRLFGVSTLEPEPGPTLKRSGCFSGRLPVADSVRMKFVFQN